MQGVIPEIALTTPIVDIAPKTLMSDREIEKLLQTSRQFVTYIFATFITLDRIE
ncbi:hypothetical protein [Nostoc sp.]|uniref:hypothetical protein n=1 Tax=Nostoc sp. TaxID=1180 RepID=UPI002FF9C5C0